MPHTMRLNWKRNHIHCPRQAAAEPSALTSKLCLDGKKALVMHLRPVRFPVGVRLKLPEEPKKRQENLGAAPAKRQDRLRQPAFTAWGKVQPKQHIVADRLEAHEVAIGFQVPPYLRMYAAGNEIDRVDQVLDRIVGDIRGVDGNALVADAQAERHPTVRGRRMLDADSLHADQAWMMLCLRVLVGSLLPGRRRTVAINEEPMAR